MTNKEAITAGNTSLGIEFGSTRIKAVLVGPDNGVLAIGSHEWENRLENGIWTYSLDDIWNGLQDCYKNLAEDVKTQYGETLTTIGSIGFSAMMHGYMAFDKDGELLVPFRTWRNTITEEAAAKLTEAFSYNIPQRWSIAHLYQAILNKEEHVANIAFFTTLAGFIHWKLTGEKVLGVGDASGMFPIDSTTGDYDAGMLATFDEMVAPLGYPWKITEILPKVLSAGEQAGVLTEEGAKLLDPSGNLKGGIPVCPPEGDAGTGMVATNSVAVRTGNVSAGTSVFAMIVLEKALEKVHTEIDLVTTPTGEAVAMVHCNNCTSDLNAWVNLFKEFAESFGIEVDMNKLFSVLYNKALEGDADCGGLLAYNYFSGESITGFEEGRPLFARTPDSKFTLANFMRVHLFTALGALKNGLDILLKEEHVQIVLEKALEKVHTEIDLVTTPTGEAVAMVHCNNCTSDLNAWVNLFKEFAESFGIEVDMNKLFSVLYNKALEGDADCGGLLAYNYFSGESITGFEEGRPLFARTPDSKFTLANFMRVHLFTALGALKNGLDILLKEEHVQIDKIYGHGGLFKTPVVGQRIMAAAMDTPVSVMKTAGEGGAWGIAVLASYMKDKKDGQSLADYLNDEVFAGQEGVTEEPIASDVAGFDEFLKLYNAGLPIERAAVETMKLNL